MFGATIWVKDLEANKLEPHAKAGKFVRYDEESKEYRVYYPKKQWVGIKQDVRFNPDEILIPDGDIGSKGEWHLPAVNLTITHDQSNTSNPLEEAGNGDEDINQPDEAETPQHQCIPDESDNEAVEPPPAEHPNVADPPPSNLGRGMHLCPAPGYYS